jgi:hypothetical protein
MFADAVISFLHDSRGAQTVLLIAQDTKVTKKINTLCSIRCTATNLPAHSVIAISPTFVDMYAWHHSSELIV